MSQASNFSCCCILSIRVLCFRFGGGDGGGNFESHFSHPLALNEKGPNHLIAWPNVCQNIQAPILTQGN